MTLTLDGTAECKQKNSADESMLASPAALQDVVDYYRQTIEDYRVWSPEGYMHFGIWRKGMNPFNRKRMLESMNDLVFEALGLSETRNLEVADLGCGVGAVARYGSRRYTGHHWYAVTVSPEQIACGRSLLDPGDEQRIEFVRSSFCDLPFADHSLDAAFFLESLCHATHPGDALKEATRVLKPGGRLVVIDGMMRKSPAETPRYASWLSRKTAESWAVGEFHCVPEFEAAVTEHGFQIEKRSEVGLNLAPCVAHSPWLIGVHSLKLLATGKLDSWKRKHLVGCTLGMFLGMLRHQFGYYVYTITKSSRHTP